MSCSGEWEPALRYINNYIAHLPGDPWGYYEKSYILTDGFGNLEGARAVLAEAIEIRHEGNPRNRVLCVALLAD